ncbi:glycosyltransferase [Streptomyces sp. NPDC048638]|uniref:glycosyltransferase n=1 Tax=Streptomyces sp. NPDC048638 TaxID=3365580 RepID=UPI0037227D61
MRIALLTMGSRGDVQPFVALGDGLRARGHRVVLGAPDALRPLVERAGLEHRTTPGDPDGFFTMPEVVEALRRSPSMRNLIKALPKAPEGYDQQVLDEIETAAEDVDLVVHSPLTVAAAFGTSRTPWLSACWWPDTETTAFPAIESGQREMGPLTPLYHHYTHVRAAAEDWVWRGPEIDEYRARRGLQPFGGDSPLRRLGRDQPHLYPFSPSVLPKPADWPGHCHVTGYWFWDEPGWEPPAGLEDFLAAGKPPIALTLGSTWPVHRQEETLRYAIDAARGAGRRLVVVGGPDGALPDDVFRLSGADYSWLFPRTAAVIHHGGFGTTAEVLRAGVPHVIVPVFADHPFWAARLFRAGLGGPPVPMRRMNRQELAASVLQAATDPAVAARARRLGKAVAAERGVDAACDVVEKWAAAKGVITAAG